MKVMIANLFVRVPIEAFSRSFWWNVQCLVSARRGGLRTYLVEIDGTRFKLTPRQAEFTLRAAGTGARDMGRRAREKAAHLIDRLERVVSIKVGKPEIKGNLCDVDRLQSLAEVA